MAKNVIIIGAGASGLTAAIAAARVGAQTTILEASSSPGKKLLVTGNGRCNLTNLSEDLPGAYFGSGAALARSVTERFGARETLAFFSELGLLTQEKNGCVYPYTMQAASVLDVLLAELRRLHVNLKFGQKILRIMDRGKKSGKRYAIETPGWTYEADAVILACGSLAAPSTGASGEGYLLAQTLGHTVITPRPALVPLDSGFPYLNRFAGVRCRAKLTLLLDGKTLAEDTGELQWTKYGISGIVAFQLSRHVRPDAEGTYEMQIDFVPDYRTEELQEILRARSRVLTGESATVLLRGMINEKLIKVLLNRAGENLAQKTSAELTDGEICSVCRTIKEFRIPITGTRSFEQAQICAGGVDCSKITGHLESRLHEDLFFAGEMLDVDGPCGGYNLQWAFSSGFLSGTYAAGSDERGEQNEQQ